MILIDDEVKTIKKFFQDENGQDDPDAFYVIREELPYDGYMAYLDAAISYELKDDQVEAETSKMKLSEIQGILMQYGLVEIHGVVEKTSKRELTASEWRRLPMLYIGQIAKAIQLTAKAQGKKDPNSDAPSAQSSN